MRILSTVGAVVLVVGLAGCSAAVEQVSADEACTTFRQYLTDHKAPDVDISSSDGMKAVAGYFYDLAGELQRLSAGVSEADPLMAGIFAEAAPSYSAVADVADQMAAGDASKFAAFSDAVGVATDASSELNSACN